MKKPQEELEPFNDEFFKDLNVDGLSPESIAAQKKIIIENAENYPFIADCESLTNHLNSLPEHENCKPAPLNGTTLSDTLLGTLKLYNDFGRYPPPELLIEIVDAGQKSLDSDGLFPLNEAMYSPAKKGVGNHSAQKHKSDPWTDFLVFTLKQNFFSDSLGQKRKSREELAEIYLNKDYLEKTKNGIKDHTLQDVDSFLRGVRRYKRSLTGGADN